MKLANEDVSMLAFTSEQITAPFLLPEMVLSKHTFNMFSLHFPFQFSAFGNFPFQFFLTGRKGGQHA